MIILIFVKITKTNILKNQNKIICGGFQNKKNPNLCEKSLKIFLLKHGYGKKIKFNYKIQKCQTQIVAGINYKMILLINNKICNFTLYKNLENPPKYSINDIYNEKNPCFKIG